MSSRFAFLWMCSDGLGTKPANMLISGGTGSGKTTLLNVLASFVPERERVITIEDTAELNLPIKHWIRMEARPPGIEGTGELKIDILTKKNIPQWENIVTISSLKKLGFEKLLKKIKTYLPKWHPYYPEDYFTFQTMDFRISEIIKNHEKGRG